MAFNKVTLRSKLTQRRLRDRLHYDPLSGVFTWKKWGRGVARSPKIAGTINPEGYRRIQIDGEIYQSSHLVWLYVTGSFPTEQIDHRNNNTSDDRFENLRHATQSLNKANSRAYKSNLLGIKGVRLHRNGQYEARIRVSKRLIYLGCFRTIPEARSAYERAAKEAFGDFAKL